MSDDHAGPFKPTVALTYDDALPSHLDCVVPALDRLGLRATFYVPVNGPRLQHRVEAWRAAARSGHELGNHSLFHPCRRDQPSEQSWMPEEYNLAHYTPRRWLEEMSVANFTLELIDGQAHRTFGNTCCDEHIGPARQISLHGLIGQLFPAARGPLNSAVVDPDRPCLAGLGHFSGDGKSLGDLQSIVDQAVRARSLAIFMFHGVGPGDHGLFVDREVHDEFIRHLTDRVGAGDIRVMPLIKCATELRRRVTR
jgi:peptidoglycan-N-acetylglucosamine deacetylase